MTHKTRVSFLTRRGRMLRAATFTSRGLAEAWAALQLSRFPTTLVSACLQDA